MVNSNYKILCPIYILWPAAISTCALSYLVLCDQTCLNGKVGFNDKKCVWVPDFYSNNSMNTQRLFLKKSTYQNKAAYLIRPEVERLQNDYNIVIQHKEVGRNSRGW